ncbi:hypothetical protein AWZ03_007229 [Drosophila navojoa]|uniref:Uncharacterized protein n=1 Tax=Drosophila navojoa TaxID=7232 RepID=A0A484BEB7_DRONA|nr:uncharacterized protein LOC108660383 [Drosophila navojoa]TDG46340.1 hypothetical protein AWZ03_007229 [Drosophila navojoa]
MENLENKELIALPLEIDIENTQHICTYLRNLRERLKHTVQQHTDLIQTSVSLVKEMSDVATTLGLTQSEPEQPPTKIKRLIMEFENMNTADNNSIEAIELRDLLADFRRLHESQLLRDSLMCYKRAKESFEKVESMLDQMAQSCPDGSQASSESSQAGGSSNCRSLREKIQAFNKASVIGQDLLQNFTHCFSNDSSVEVESAEEVKVTSNSNWNSGYEGDVDSEMDPITDELDDKLE